MMRASHSVSLGEIARAVGAEVHGAATTVVTGASGLGDAGQGDLSYVDSEKSARSAHQSKATAFVVGTLIPDLDRPQLVARNPRYAFARIVQDFFTLPLKRRGVAPEVVRGQDVEIGPDASFWPFVTLGDRAKIGARVTLYPGTFVGEDAVIGDDSVLHPNVTVGRGCTIGKRVTIHAGTVIGSDGFGYVMHDGRHQKIPQLGTVEIEDDVELGANVTVDRATFGRTLIRRGTKVDNLVQIAHNVTIGEHSILTAQVGIAGSTKLGSYVVVGGQAAITDHIELGDRVMVAGRAAVSRSVPAGQVVSGAPAIPHEIFVKAQAVIPRLPELRQQVRDMEKRLRALEAALAEAAAAAPETREPEQG